MMNIKVKLNQCKNFNCKYNLKLTSKILKDKLK